MNSLVSFERLGFGKRKNEKLFDTRGISAFLKKIGNPQDKISVIHIAGSKGKGTTAAFIARGLQKNGKKVGLFTSPYFFSAREMIEINGKKISKNNFSKLAAEFKLAPLTQFEFLTAIAFIYFYRQGVDFAVIEAGLGGRCDATNVCRKPILTILAKIEKEHTDYFGPRLRDIVEEKCGILRRGVPIICYDSSRYVNAKIRKCAKRVGAPILGFFDSNEKAAFRACDKILPGQSPKHSENIFKNTFLPGRFEIVKRRRLTWVFDVAHTPASAAYLRERINEKFPKKSIVFLMAFLRDKAAKKIVKILVHPKDSVIFAVLNHPRAAHFPTASGVSTALETAIAAANKKDKILCVTGSFRTVAETKRCLKHL